MFEHYLAALLNLGQAGDLSFSALPDVPVQPQREDSKADWDRRIREPASPPPNLSRALAPARRPVAAEPTGSSEWDPCPCRQWGVARGDRHGCAALVKELFAELDQELDQWEAAYGWLYR